MFWSEGKLETFNDVELRIGFLAHDKEYVGACIHSTNEWDANGIIVQMCRKNEKSLLTARCVV